MEKMQTTKIGENYFIRDLELGYYPTFSYELNRRVKNKEACIVTICGEAGTSKSYTAIQLALNIDKRFGIKQIVFTYNAYLEELDKGKMGIPIVFDEPSYAMGKREWYKQINQALVKTIESQRFLVRPLLIPIINVSLLDKTLRDYLVIFQVNMTKRGRAMVYRLRASQGQSKTYRYFMGYLHYPILDFDKCKRDTCLGCKKLPLCPFLRAQYERKKSSIQFERYEQDQMKAIQLETSELTDNQLCSLAKAFEGKYLEDNIVNARLLRVIMREELGIKIGQNKSYLLKELIEYRLNK